MQRIRPALVELQKAIGVDHAMASRKLFADGVELLFDFSEGQLGTPEGLFFDRSLGRIKVPRLLREHGLQLVTFAEHYGIPADESASDEEWLQLAGERGWAESSQSWRYTVTTDSDT